MKRFRVKIETILEVEFEEDRPTEKTAAWVAEKIGLSIDKEGFKNQVGKFKITGRIEDAHTIESKLK